MPFRLWRMNEQKKRNKKDPSQMRHGYTTGACATAMTKAALQALVVGKVPDEVTIYLPAGQYATFKVSAYQVAEDRVMCETIKDAGDDPDATHQARIQSTVCYSKEKGIHLDGGVGVGRVTKAGLPVPVGQAAINPVPRKMIYGVVQEAIEKFKLDCGIEVIISVPDGEEIAEKNIEWAVRHYRRNFDIRYTGNSGSFFKFCLYGKYCTSHQCSKRIRM